MKKNFLVLWVAVMSLSPVSQVSADTKTVTSGITGGALTMSVPNVTLSTVNYDLNSSMLSETALDVVVQDDRGTGAGWGVSLSVSDFTATIPDKSNGTPGATITVAVPASSLRSSVWYVTPNEGQLPDAAYGPKAAIASGTYLSNAPTNIISSDAGYGMGKYTIGLSHQLLFPKKIAIQSLSHPGTSKLSPGSQIGLAAATYTSSFFYDLNVGI